MSVRQAPIYEQVSANLPGKPFRPSGFYRHAGDMVNKKFIKATRPSPLRTYAQLRTTEGLATAHPAMRWRCAMCLSYLKGELDATGQYPRCPQCGHSEERAPEYIPEDDKYPLAFAAPDTGARIVERQRAIRDGLPLPAPVPVQMVRLGPPPKPFVATPMGDTTARAVARQRQLGQRPADPYKPLHVMDTTPCERCHKTSCGCPPKAPDVLGQAAKRAAIRTQQEQDTAMIAYPQLRRGTI